MRNKSLFLLLAGIAGSIAAVGVGQWMQAKSGSTVEMAEILVTTVSVNPDEEITADKLRLEQWPADKVPQGASADLSQFAGRFAKVPLFAGEPMLDQKLMNEVEDNVVPRGYTVVAIDAGRDGTASLLKPGDRVDLRGFFPKGEMFARNTALDVLTGVKVWAIDGVTKFDEDEPRSRNARNIQLLIRKADVDAFDFAKKLGEISLVLGSPAPSDENISDGEMSEKAQKFMKDLQDRRDEQERLLRASRNNGPDPQPTTNSGPAKEKFRVKKIVDGRIIVFEFTEGDPVPRIIADTGALDLGLTTESTSDSDTATQDTATTGGDDYLRGADSPFFAPEEGQ
ncbi:MAG: Flp pilus assembly protein CpaB [Planctomycetota bacterium]